MTTNSGWVAQKVISVWSHYEIRGRSCEGLPCSVDLQNLRMPLTAERAIWASFSRGRRKELITPSFAASAVTIFLMIPFCLGTAVSVGCAILLNRDLPGHVKSSHFWFSYFLLFGIQVFVSYLTYYWLFRLHAEGRIVVTLSEITWPLAFGLGVATLAYAFLLHLRLRRVRRNLVATIGPETSR